MLRENDPRLWIFDYDCHFSIKRRDSMAAAASAEMLNF